MVLLRFFGDLALMGDGFKANTSVVCFNQLFQVVDVDELDVKLVVVMFDFGELFAGERAVGKFLELAFESVDLFALGTK